MEEVGQTTIAFTDPQPNQLWEELQRLKTAESLISNSSGSKRGWQTRVSSMV